MSRQLRNLSPEFGKALIPLKVALRKHLIGLDLPMMARTVTLRQQCAGEVSLPPECLPSDETLGYFIEHCTAESSTLGVHRHAGRLVYTPYFYERHYVDFSLGYTRYWHELPGAKRQAIRRKMRRLEKAFSSDLEFRVGRTADQISAFFDDIAPLLSGYRHKGRTLSARPDFIAKCREVAERGELRTYTLRADPHVLSYLFCPIVEDSLIYEFMGYDPEWARFSPGFVLLFLAIEDNLKSQECSWLDFTRGSGQQKRFFATNKIDCADRFYLKDTAVNRLMFLAHYKLNFITHSLEVARARRRALKKG